MTAVEATVEVPGPAGEAQALWLDPRRWPSFVDGFGSLYKVDPGWPAEGKAVWVSTPNGRGRVAEAVVRHEIGRETVTEVEDERVRGTQTASFGQTPGGGVRVAIRFEYEIKDDRFVMKLADKLFIRRSQRDALQRTLRRYASERAGDVAED